MRNEKGDPLDDSSTNNVSLSLQSTSESLPAWQQIEEDVLQSHPIGRLSIKNPKKRKPQTALEPIHTSQQHVRDRLNRRIMNSSSLRRVNEAMDMFEDRMRRENFGNTWYHSFPNEDK